MGLWAVFSGEAQQRRGDELALTHFRLAIRHYGLLDTNAQGSLPPLEITADPQKIHDAVAARAARIRLARSDARQGDIFTPDVCLLFRTRIQETLRDHDYDVADLLAEMMADTEPAAGRPSVSGPFLWDRGTATPPSLLMAFPPLPERLQYRFVDCDLVLADIDANLVVDILPDALPTEACRPAGPANDALAPPSDWRSATTSRSGEAPCQHVVFP